jgi:hypothetical protein
MNRKIEKMNDFTNRKTSLMGKPLNAHKRSITLLLAAAFSGAAMPGAFAQEQAGFSVSGSLEAGVEYNSNVSVEELDSAIGASDNAAVIDGSVELSWKPVQKLTVDGGYSYSSRSYREFDQFDLDMHLMYADVSYDFEPLTLGTNYYLADAQLGGDDFLTLKQYSIYAGKLVSDRWFLRGALNFSDKSFDFFSERDSEGEGVGLDTFYFFNEGRSTLVMGVSIDEEVAAANQYSYDARTLRLRYTNRFSLLQKDARIQLGVRAQDRDYLGIDPAIGTRRDDRQLLAEARFELKMNSWLELVTQLERGSYSSNLPSADYNENRAMLGLKLSF